MQACFFFKWQYSAVPFNWQLTETAFRPGHEVKTKHSRHNLCYHCKQITCFLPDFVDCAMDGSFYVSGISCCSLPPDSNKAMTARRPGVARLLLQSVTNLSWMAARSSWGDDRCCCIEFVTHGHRDGLHLGVGLDRWIGNLPKVPSDSTGCHACWCICINSLICMSMPGTAMPFPTVRLWTSCSQSKLPHFPVTFKMHGMQSGPQNSSSCRGFYLTKTSNLACHVFSSQQTIDKVSCSLSKPTPGSAERLRTLRTGRKALDLLCRFRPDSGNPLQGWEGSKWLPPFRPRELLAKLRSRGPQADTPTDMQRDSPDSSTSAKSTPQPAFELSEAPLLLSGLRHR